MTFRNNFKYFSYFHRYLGYRVFVTFILSFLVGLLDGIGLAMFIPLLQLVSNTGETSGSSVITDFVLEVLQISPTVFNILMLILIFFSLKGLVKFVEGSLRVLYQQYFMRKIRLTNIDLFNRFDFLRFTRTDAGRIQNTFSGEVSRVNTAFKFYFKAFQYGVLVLVYITMAFMADARFALMVAIGGVGTNFLFKFLYNRTKNLSRKLTSQNHNFQGLLLQMVALFKYLKTTGLNYKYSEKLKKNIYSLEKTQQRIGIIDSLLNALREPVVILVVIIAIYLQLTLFDREMGLIIWSLLLLYRALTFFMATQEQWNVFLGVSGSLENMDQFTLELEKGKETNGNKKFGAFTNKLELQGIAFTYDKTPVLKQIDLKVRKNETIAFIGESGSGKTTLMNLISGLLVPTQGKYLVDGTSITDLDLNSFKSRIGYIAQEAPIFNDTIFNNVTFWAELSTDNLQKFNRAINKAAIGDFVRSCPEQEYTILGNNGINLSGGQKQRIAIARELYKEVDLLLMDEATSALDSETETVIQQNIEKLKGQLTIIVIAHRLATIRNVDRIVLLRGGRVEAEGTFSELMQDSAHFQEMIRLQNL